jgi:hypothetical protein
MTPQKALAGHGLMMLCLGKMFKISLFILLQKFTLKVSYETLNLSTQLELLPQG